MEPTHGSALVEGRDITTDMTEVYRLMGVCPQHDLLWETLTGREHLLFYGRLQGLTGGGRDLGFRLQILGCGSLHMCAQKV